MNAPRKMTKVLVTDDDMAQRLLLRACLETDGYEVWEAEDGSEAVDKLASEPDIRLLLTDLNMPKMDGYELIRTIREKELRYTYIIILTSMNDRESLLRGLSVGADDYLTKPVFPDELKLRLRGGTRLLKLESQDLLIFSMAKLAEYRSQETGFHLERVSHYTRLIARDISKNHPELRLSLSMADEIGMVSSLHDIGKVAIPDRILHKPGRLTLEECSVMKTHTTIGGEIIKDIYDMTGSLYLWLAHEIAMYHHERWDGRGYPLGLAGEDIPISGRIMALADVYDALNSKRCYKDPFPYEKVRGIILQERGHHFDPKVVDAFLRQEDACLAIKQRFRIGWNEMDRRNPNECL
ncbi:HD domain-containing phosphohydrolase [Desulfonema magnum]|uniref:Two component system response regulator, HD domain-containing n=1 Tax=Desulfonema magnum TaxID=45655 RepID=A0A975GQN1_9BACT|nr:HD domain-containing phosphohydrolase [Desulfonema magnum]QTA90074.1 Two component system response regulator, HD domain-containing [Desulfonema magnum]